MADPTRTDRGPALGTRPAGLAGIVLVDHWHPDRAASEVPDARVHMYGAIGRKP